VHCIDLPFAFDVLDAERVTPITGDDPPQALADDVHRAWVGFVRDGDPGWPAYELDHRSTMVFDVPSHLEVDWHHAARTAFEGVR
jgi:para-nitrobenzyl esterase